MDLIETSLMEPEEGRAQLYCVAELLDDGLSDAQRRYAAKNEGLALAPVTGLSRLDEKLGGGLMQGLHIVHGAPGVGKTAWCLQIATSCGCPALYISCEMPRLSLLKRLAARITGTFLGRFDTGELAPAVALELYQQAAQQSAGLAILDATLGPADLKTVYEAAVATRMLAPDNPHLLIVVDSVHTWADGLMPGVEEYERLNGAIRSLQLLSARLSCSVLGIAERNRASMRTGGQSASAGNRGFEYGTHSVIELDFDLDKSTDKPIPDADGNVDVRLVLSKNRNGVPYWEGKLRFCGKLQRYQEVY